MLNLQSLLSHLFSQWQGVKDHRPPIEGKFSAEDEAVASVKAARAVVDSIYCDSQFRHFPAVTFRTDSGQQ
jgi:hypothetical protein